MMNASLKQRTARGLAWGGLSTVMQQAIGLLFGIILGRLLSPSEYGMVAMIMVFQLIATALQDSGFKVALTNLTNPTHQDYNSVFWFNVSMGTVLYVVLFFCAPFIADYYHEDALVPLCRYAFLTLFCSSLGTSQAAWLFKNMRVRQQATAGIVAVLVSSVVGVTMACLGCSYWSLATQNIVFVAVNTIIVWCYSDWCPTLTGITMKPVRRMFAFSGKLLATTIVGHINNNMLNVLLGRHFSPYDTGNYNQAQQWNFKGYYVVQNMVHMVAQPVLVDLRNDASRQLAALRKMVRFTAFLSFPLLLGFGLVAKEFIVLAITDKWLVSAGFIQIMCVCGAVIPISNVLANLVISNGRSGAYFWVTFSLGVVQIVSLSCLWPFGISVMVIAHTVITTLWVFVWFALVSHLFRAYQYNDCQYGTASCRYRLWQFLADILPFALTACAVMVVTYFATCSITEPWFLLIARVMLAATLYFIAMKMARVKILDECLNFVLKRKMS